jgi:hypothetical protein
MTPASNSPPSSQLLPFLGVQAHYFRPTTRPPPTVRSARDPRLALLPTLEHAQFSKFSGLWINLERSVHDHSSPKSVTAH